MKTRAKRRIAIALAATMALQCMVFSTSAFAAEGAAFDQPERPEVTSYLDNDQIEEYNSKVDEYNAAAEAYNASVDSEYEAAVAETEAKNAEIDQHNAAEIERVKAVEERNAQAVKDAEEANAKIDEENAAEEASVIEHNNNEDAKVKASEDAKKAAEEENEAIKAHNEAVEKYTEDKAKYDEAYAQYQKDLTMEQKIKAAGYASVEQYNNMIDTYYNAPARASVEKNANANVVTAKDTYSVEEAAVKSGKTVKVRIAHIFEGTDVSYIDEFEIDRNDVITINSIAALGNATQPGYASLYYNTDEAHQMGYWVPWDELQYNARYVNSNWNCGTSYEISYKDGKNHAYDEEVIYMTYNYTWVPQKVYKTYNVPVAPEELTNPGEAKDLVDVPEIYNPEYREFVKKLHVEAQLEAIEEANILENIAAPVKAAYMELLSHMALFEAPAADDSEDIIPVIPASTSSNTPAAPTDNGSQAAPAAISNDAAPAAAQTADSSAAVEISQNEVPAAAASIEDDAAPQAEGTGYWALINLLLTIGAALMSLLAMAFYFIRKREDNEEETEESEIRRKGMMRVLTAIPAILAVITFLLTENMANPMRLADDWTLLMAVFFAAGAVLTAMSRKSEKENEKNEELAAEMM